MGQSWETPFVEVPEGPITEETIPDLIDRFHAEYERRYGNRFEYVPVQGVTYRVELVVPAEKVEYRAQQLGAALEPEPDRRLELRHLADGRPGCRRAPARDDSLPAPASSARRSSARPSRRRSSARARRQRSARFGEIVIERRHERDGDHEPRQLIRDLGDEAVRGPLRL